MLLQKLFWLHFVLNWVSFKDRDDIHFFLFFPFFLIGGKRSILYIFCMGGNLKRSFDSKTWSVAGWVKSLLLKSEEISWQTLASGLVGCWGTGEREKNIEKSFCSGFTMKILCLTDNSLIIVWQLFDNKRRFHVSKCVL